MFLFFQLHSTLVRANDNDGLPIQDCGFPDLCCFNTWSSPLHNPDRGRVSIYPYSIVNTEAASPSIHFDTLYEVARILPAVQVNSCSPTIHTAMNNKQKAEQSTSPAGARPSPLLLLLGAALRLLSRSLASLPRERDQMLSKPPPPG